MGSGERREREKAERRSKIVEAARELLVAEGYDAVTMRRVAEKIEYTPTMLYNYFKDKEELVRTILDPDFQELRKAFGIMGAIADPVDRLRALTAGYVSFANAHPSAYKFMFLMQHPSPPPTEPAIEHRNLDEDAYAFLLATVADGIANGRYREEYTDANFLAQMLWAGIHGVVAIHMFKGCDKWLQLLPLRETAMSLSEAMLRGVLRET